MDYHFKSSPAGTIPLGAQPHGHEADGTPLWVARSTGRHLPSIPQELWDGIQPGKVRPGFGVALIPFGGKELPTDDYVVLMEAGIWLPGQNGRIPAGAIVCGWEANGDPLFVARASLNGGIHPGKIRFAFGAAFIGFGGKEVPVANYEVLVSQGGLL